MISSKIFKFLLLYYIKLKVTKSTRMWNKYRMTNIVCKQVCMTLYYVLTFFY